MVLQSFHSKPLLSVQFGAESSENLRSLTPSFQGFVCLCIFAFPLPSNLAGQVQMVFTSELIRVRARESLILKLSL